MFDSYYDPDIDWSRIADVMARHQKIAIQFSGGKDSLATLYLLRNWWDKVTVYYLNAGAPFPETTRTINRVRNQVPHFVEIMGNQPEVIAEHGMPSDIVPANNTALGIYLSGDGAGVKIQDRYSCCARSIMHPLQQRMEDDGITLIIRGQRNAEKLKARTRDGDVVGGFELLLPIEHWTDDDVLNYLNATGVPVPDFYESMTTSHECVNCTAYLELGMAKYLRDKHPDLYAANQARLKIIRDAIIAPINNLNSEIGT